MKVFVSRHKWSHSKRRKQFRHLRKEGVAKVIEETKEGWLYWCPDTVKLAKRG